MPKTKQEKALRAEAPESVRPSGTPRQMERHTFTPGPWETNGALIWQEGPETNVADAQSPRISLSVEQCWANARLIAAAPELLESVRLAHAFLDSLPNGWLAHTSGDVGALNDFYIKSRAALTKAGEKP